jgi:hypothetical protein
MTHEQANKIFETWKEFVEFADKFHRLFMCGVPESFLPYPHDVLEEALTIISKSYLDDGNKKMYDSIQSTMWSVIGGVKEDAEAFEQITKFLSMASEHPDLKATVLEKLKECRESWAKTRKV